MVFQANQKTRAFHTQVNNAAYSNYNSVINDCDVLSVVGMNVEINSGRVFFQGTPTDVTGDTLTIANGHASYPRIDVIAFDGVDLIVLQGTPEAYPYPPDYNPASYVIIQQVYVEANETSLVVGDITDLRVLTAAFSTTSLGRYVEPGISSQTSVVVTHNLDDSTPAVFAYDNSGVMVMPESVTINTSDDLTVTFSPAFSGDIAILGGNYTGTGGGSGGTGTLTVQEQDGAPYVIDVSRIKVSNGSLTDDGSGVVSIQVANTYLHTQSTSLTSWVITHSLGQQLVNVQCYDNTGAWVQPHSIQLNNANQCTVTFLTATAGQAIVKK